VSDEHAPPDESADDRHHSKQSRLPAVWLVLMSATVLWSVIGLISFGAAAVTSLAVHVEPEARHGPLGGAWVASVYYTAVCFASVVGAWVFHAVRRRGAALGCALFPLVNMPIFVWLGDSRF
jgi:hypothetical protein